MKRSQRGNPHKCFTFSLCFRLCLSAMLSCCQSFQFSVFPANGKIYSHCLHINSKYANIHYVAWNLFIRFVSRLKCTLALNSGPKPIVSASVAIAAIASNRSCLGAHTNQTNYASSKHAEVDERERESERKKKNQVHLINFSTKRALVLFMHHIWWRNLFFSALSLLLSVGFWCNNTASD